MKSWENLVALVQENNEDAFTQIVKDFRPLLIKESCRNGKFDDDCYQECLIKLFLALKNYKIRK